LRRREINPEAALQMELIIGPADHGTITWTCASVVPAG